MKSIPKFLTIFFLSIFILQLLCLTYLLLMPQISQAADQATFKPQVEIPGMTQEFGPAKDTGYVIPGSTASIAKYVRLIYKYAIGIVGILAAVVLMIGGVMWIVAGGNATAIGEAKAWIGASISGLIIALTSYLILATVNPALVEFRVTPIKTVENTTKGCCEEANNEGTETMCGMVMQSQCNGKWLPNNVCLGYKTCAQTSQLTTNTEKNCQDRSGTISGIVKQSDTAIKRSLCIATCNGQGKTISEESFFIVVGDGYLTGFCCLCK